MAAMPEMTIESRSVYEGHLISVRVDEVALDGGRRSQREVVEHPGAVAILPWDGERLCLVRQWRHATGGDLLEVPAGTLDVAEEPLATAVRELAEECGLAAARWEEGPTFYTAPGFCTELMHLYLATDLTEAASIGGDEDEEITIEWRMLDEALGAIDGGEIRDAKSIAGVLWLARRAAR
jgi:nudix-type nucleoside diphosphatase (YffH/AdpP family)